MGARVGIKEDRAEKIISRFTSKEEKVIEQVNQSFLPDKLKSSYIELVTERRERLRILHLDESGCYFIKSCYVKNMNGLDLGLYPNLNPPLTLKKVKIMIRIKNACKNKDCVRRLINTRIYPCEDKQ